MEDEKQPKSKGEENVIQPIEKKIVNAMEDIGGDILDTGSHSSGDSGDNADDAVEKMSFSFPTKTVKETLPPPTQEQTCFLFKEY